MAFDWSKIEGYRDDMSADEKLALLENAEQPSEPAEPNTPEPEPTEPAKPEPKVPPKPGYISKREFDKLASDLAAAKRQLRSRMSEDEQREADRQAELAAREEELASLRREKTLSTNTASFLGLGFPEDLAGEAAQMLADGDTEGLFMTLKRYQTGYEKALRTKILAETPKPPATDPNSEEAKKKDQAQLRKYFGLA